nr:hypothetical protein [Nanoarchaeum sp.]
MDWLTAVYLFYILTSLYVTFFSLIIYYSIKHKFFEEDLEEYTPNLTVLIPAYNEEETIASTIEAVQANDYPKDKLQIIVIDDGSKDKTAEIVKKYKDVILFSKKNSGKADSVNQAIKQVKSEFFCIIDADSYPEQDALRLLMRKFKDEQVGAVTGTILVKNKRNMIEKCQAMEYVLIAWTRRLLDAVESVFVTPGALSAYRKSAVEKVGGFDKNIMTEDIEIAWNLLKHNYKIRMDPQAHAFTSVPTTVKAWWRQRVRWDIGGFQTFEKHKKALFKTDYNMFGVFVIPFFLSHLVLSFTGFFVFLYVLLKQFYNWAIFTFFSIETQSQVFDLSEIYLIPSVFTYFAVLLLLLFGYSIYLSLKTLKKAKIRIDLSFFVYSLFYLATFPILLIISIYKWKKGYSKW